MIVEPPKILVTVGGDLSSAVTIPERANKMLVTPGSRCSLASFPGPAQLSVAFSTVKWERAWYLIWYDYPNAWDPV